MRNCSLCCLSSFKYVLIWSEQLSMWDLFLCLFTDVLVYANQSSFVCLQHYLLNQVYFQAPFLGFHGPVPQLILVDWVFRPAWYLTIWFTYFFYVWLFISFILDIAFTKMLQNSCKQKNNTVLFSLPVNTHTCTYINKPTHFKYVVDVSHYCASWRHKRV